MTHTAQDKGGRPSMWEYISQLDGGLENINAKGEQIFSSRELRCASDVRTCGLLIRSSGFQP